MAIGVDQDDQRPARAERDEFDVADRALGLRCEDQAGALRQAGEHGAGLGQRVLQAAARGTERGGDRLALVLGQFAEVQQAVDEQAQALIGGQAAGGGMRREQQAGIRQVRHDIADGGRRQADRQPARQGAAADRLASFHVLLDHFAQNGSRAGIEAGRQDSSEGMPGWLRVLSILLNSTVQIAGERLDTSQSDDRHYRFEVASSSYLAQAIGVGNVHRRGQKWITTGQPIKNGSQWASEYPGRSSGRRWDLEKGGVVVSTVENGELRIRTVKAVLDELRERLAPHLKASGDTVDQFIADRHAEADQEEAEYQLWKASRRQ